MIEKLLLKKKLCIYFLLCWMFIASCAFSLVVEGRGHSLAAVCGLLMLWLLLLWSRALGHASFGSCSFQALEHRFNRCGTQTSCFEECGIFWIRGKTQICSASAGGLFTTEPSGKPERLLFINSYVNIVMFIIIPFCITSCMLFISSLC